MTVRLQLVLDQVVTATDPDLEMASRELAHQLIDAAPADCVVDAVYPAGDIPALAGIARERRLRLPRRELGAAWRFGLAPEVRGIVHSPTLMAPLARHDRANDNDQIVVTLWDLRPWDAPSGLARGDVSWQRAMLRRAARYADAIVVPTHAMADRLRELAPAGERVRVIAGAAPAGFAVPSDEAARRRELVLPDNYVALTASPDDDAAITAAFRAVAAVGTDTVVFDTDEGTEPRLADLASAAGLPERRVHIRGRLDRGDRAVVLDSAAAFIAGSTHSVWPWRVVEAMALGTPLVAADSPEHREVIVDGGVIVPQGDLPDALGLALGSSAERLRVLSRDRGRAFSWRESADRVWQLHADL